VRVSPVSRGAALLIVLVGVVTYYYIDDVAGIVFIVLGLALYWLLYRFTRRVESEVEKAKTPTGSG
jgi:membrane protein implicated in regulation of membrane protease activity